MRRLVRDLNGTYRSKPALHARDCEGDGFEWLLADDRDNSVFAWLRKAPGEKLVAVITNFTPVYRENYTIPLPVAGRWKEILNTDAEIYGGSGKGNGGAVQAQKDQTGAIAATITLPPLATLMLEQD
jgi:1,4-alpha-glucan branching enzyme